MSAHLSLSTTLTQSNAPPDRCRRTDDRPTCSDDAREDDPHDGGGAELHDLLQDLVLSSKDWISRLRPGSCGSCGREAAGAAVVHLVRLYCWWDFDLDFWSGVIK